MEAAVDETLASSSPSSPSSSGGEHIVLETLLLLGVRLGFFLAAQQYLRRSLYADLREVIRDETSLASVGTHSSQAGTLAAAAGGSSSGLDSPDSSSEYGFSSLRDQLHSLRAGNNTSPGTLLPTTARSSPGAGAGSGSGLGERRRSGQGVSGHRNTSDALVNNGNTRDWLSTATGSPSKGLPPRLASAIFCFSVSECMTLFALLLFGGAVGEKARILSWELSLGNVLGLIVIIIPLGMCLLFSLRSRVASVSKRRIVTVTAVPFAFWIVGLYTVGDWIGKALGVETTEKWSFGLLTSTLDRICVPGTVLIAALSGGAAVNSAWEAFEWRERTRSAEIVTDGHLNAAARSLNQTRTDLAARFAEMEAIQSGNHGDSDQGFFGRMFGSSPHATKIKSLQTEIAGLEAMESQMTKDLQLMRKRMEITELGQTWYGKFRQAMGWIFSLYCVYRIVISLINLIFGTISGSANHTKPSDLVSSILGKLADAFGWNLDIATWSKVVGLILIGSIIFVNLRFVLGYVSRVFRATSAGNSASFMLLFLSQLLAVYLITSLISLPSVEDQSDRSNPAAILLDTLPDFRVFQRLFDAVFLLTATAVFAGRWLHRKIRADEHLGLQDFV